MTPKKKLIFLLIVSTILTNTPLTDAAKPTRSLEVEVIPRVVENNSTQYRSLDPVS